MQANWPTWIALAFLSGSIPFGVILAKAHGVDLRTVGSGNVGATNVGRALGRTWGFLCFALDAAKGAAPVIAAGMLAGPWARPVSTVPPGDFLGWIAVVFAALLGHVFSPWIGFKGGKGVATGFGAMVAMWPVLTFPTLLALATWIACMRFTRIVSLSSMVAAWSLPLWCGVLLPRPEATDPGSPWWPIGTTSLLAALVMATHRANIRRLLAGTEARVGTKPPATIAP
ncbi:MAG: glycerol-3-phosphate 1-O-acyltransferase [Planctomycetes bacterium]|nr:glycerol-3-phosphate 1-O-acyltransferase [Planctomycetota bacterium]